MKPEALYTTKEAAEILRVKPLTIRLWIKRGLLKAAKIGRLYRIRAQDLEDFLARFSNEVLKEAPHDA